MKPRVNLRLDAQLLAMLEDVAFEHQTTKTAVLEAALRHFFSEERDYTLEDRVMKRMDNFETRMGRLEWKTNLSIEIMSHYMHYWLTRTDPLPPSGGWQQQLSARTLPCCQNEKRSTASFSRQPKRFF
jgi:hypothetical protein